MKTLDRYLTSQFIGPFLIGVGAFVGILLGVGEIYRAVRLVVRDGFPMLLVLQVFFLRMPGVIALTLPMATVFAALMVSGELSSHGEITAMRAGGVSFWRLSAPMLTVGLIISIVAFAFNESISPRCNDLANTMLREYATNVKQQDTRLELWIPDTGPPKLLVCAEEFSPRDKLMKGVLIVDFATSEWPDIYFAKTARWVSGGRWELYGVEHRWQTVSGYREMKTPEEKEPVVYTIGKSPEEMSHRRDKPPENYTLSGLLGEIHKLRQKDDARGLYTGRIRELLQHLHLRFAIPWAAIGMILLGFPLGVRPQRTSTGIGFGISLAIVFVYYIVFNVLKALGEQGALAPALAAWIPNIVVFGVGLGLMIDASR